MGRGDGRCGTHQAASPVDAVQVVRSVAERASDQCGPDPVSRAIAGLQEIGEIHAESSAGMHLQMLAVNIVRMQITSRGIGQRRIDISHSLPGNPDAVAGTVRLWGSPQVPTHQIVRLMWSHFQTAGWRPLRRDISAVRKTTGCRPDASTFTDRGWIAWMQERSRPLSQPGRVHGPWRFARPTGSSGGSSLQSPAAAG